MKPTILRGTDRCIFCGGKPTNKEHVYSKWTHRHVKKVRGKYKSLRVIRKPDGSEERTEGRGKGDIHDWQVKCVDEQCNNGWMRTQLEDKAKLVLTPLIRGEITLLSPQSCRIIAGWATLKAIIGEYEFPDMITWDATARARLRRVRLPPPDICKIWIGYYPRKLLSGDWSHAPFPYFAGKENRKRFGKPTTEFNCAATTQILGNLLIHTIHASSRSLFRIFRFAPQVGRKLRMIWPIPGEQIAWPIDPLSKTETDYVAWALRDTLIAKTDRALARLREGS